jgi:hypothetical protein
MQDDLVKTPKNTPNILKRHRPSSASARRPRKKRTNPSAQASRNEENSEINDSVTFQTEIMELIKEGTASLEKLATNFENIATKLRIIMAGGVGEQELTKQ